MQLAPRSCDILAAMSLPYHLLLACLLVPVVVSGCGSSCGCGSSSSDETAGGGGAGTQEAAGGAGAQEAAGGAPGNAALDGGSLQGWCVAQCEQRERCGSLDEETPVEECADECVLDWGQPEVYRSDVMAALTACYEEVECSESSDSCLREGALVVSSDPDSDPRMVECGAKSTTCEATASPFHDDLCLIGYFLESAAAASFDACLDEPCESAADCARGVYRG